MKNALVNLIKSFGLFIWESIKWLSAILNRPLIQDTVVPITYGAITMEAFKHAPYMVAPLIFLFIATMSRNIKCTDLERWRRDHPQTREELNKAIDHAIESTHLPGLSKGNLHIIMGKPKGS